MSPKKVAELTEKKCRMETGLFIVEGEKNILELLTSDFEVVALLATKPFLSIARSEILAYEKKYRRFACDEVTESVLKSCGTLMSNNTGIAVARQKKAPALAQIMEEAQKNIVIVLDDIRDPGNLGTIIRTANWYGVTHIIASLTTTDFYNPKVIAASMGSFTRMSISYLNLEEVFKEAVLQQLSIITAGMQGENTHTAKIPHFGFLVMGSESHGISSESEQYATNTVTIPRFGDAESLNVSVATGILLDTLTRTK